MNLWPSVLFSFADFQSCFFAILLFSLASLNLSCCDAVHRDPWQCKITGPKRMQSVVLPWPLMDKLKHTDGSSLDQNDATGWILNLLYWWPQNFRRCQAFENQEETSLEEEKAQNGEKPLVGPGLQEKEVLVWTALQGTTNRSKVQHILQS